MLLSCSYNLLQYPLDTCVKFDDEFGNTIIGHIMSFLIDIRSLDDTDVNIYIKIRYTEKCTFYISNSFNEDVWIYSEYLLNTIKNIEVI